VVGVVNQVKDVSLTGDRPTGKLHLGHYVGSLKNRVKLQEEFDSYVMIADIQALTDNFENPKKVQESVFEVCKDYLSVGIDPAKTTIFVQSQIPELAELTVYYMNLVNLGRLERNPTVKAEIELRRFEGGIPVGFLCYPISQTADITAFKAKYIPVGEDQLPMIEQSNEIVRRFNRLYNCEVLVESEPYLSNTQRLIGIDGKAKASKSLNNAIFLSDSSDCIKQKVFDMYTDPSHVRAEDPGNVEGNVVFTYLDAFYENKDYLSELKESYKKGGVGDTAVKSILNATLQELLEPVREKRERISCSEVLDILKSGSDKAREVAAGTLGEVRRAIGISYF
jgi:tryptophanyl-tRNA synthetase